MRCWRRPRCRRRYRPSGGTRVNSEQAQAFLQHYRPTVDAEDPRFREALEQVQRDPALAQWFTEHCTSYEVIRRTLRQTPVPAGMRAAILQAHERRRPAGWWPQPAGVALAVVAVIVITIIGYGVYKHRSVGTPPRDFAAYLQTITRVAAGRYKLSMLCFVQEDEAPHDKATTEDHDVWFFVISRAAFPDAPASQTPRFAPAYGLITASWSSGDTTYVLGTRGAQ